MGTIKMMAGEVDPGHLYLSGSCVQLYISVQLTTARCWVPDTNSLRVFQGL